MRTAGDIIRGLMPNMIPQVWAHNPEAVVDSEIISRPTEGTVELRLRPTFSGFVADSGNTPAREAPMNRSVYDPDKDRPLNPGRPTEPDTEYGEPDERLRQRRREIRAWIDSHPRRPR